jgi:hypothetical protein
MEAHAQVVWLKAVSLTQAPPGTGTQRADRSLLSLSPRVRVSRLTVCTVLGCRWSLRLLVRVTVMTITVVCPSGHID